MALPNIFNQAIASKVIERINELTPNSKPLWGKMNATQVLAHCNVTYEMVYENKHSKPNFFMSFILKAFVKKVVVSETPYKKSSQTAPEFIIKDERNFDQEKTRLINYINKTVELGEPFFNQKESLSFGALSVSEWNNLFYKHLNHHLNQFGV